MENNPPLELIYVATGDGFPPLGANKPGLLILPESMALLVQPRPLHNSAVASVPVKTGQGFVLLNQNRSRGSFKIWNDSGAELLIRESTEGELCTADNWSYKVAAGTMYESYVPCFTGRITAFSVAGAGVIRVTEAS